MGKQFDMEKENESELCLQQLSTDYNLNILLSIMIDSEDENYKISEKFFRESMSISDMADKTIDWINMYLHISRLVSISTHICHSTGQPMIYVYYKEGPFMSPHVYQSKKGYRIGYEILENPRSAKYSWRNQHIDLMPKLNELVQRDCNIFAVNNLQTGKEHDKNISIIWYTFENNSSETNLNSLKLEGKRKSQKESKQKKSN